MRAGESRNSSRYRGLPPSPLSARARSFSSTRPVETSWRVCPGSSQVCRALRSSSARICRRSRPRSPHSFPDCARAEMPDPVVTLIVASHNGERFLAETLNSAFAQTFQEFDVVFVDDGSEDGTADIARSFPLIYVRQSNLGLAAARNTGLAHARGEFVAFLDDDDVLPPTKLEVQVRYLQEHPDIGCVLGRQEWIFEGMKPPKLTRDPIFGEVGGIQFVTAMIRRRVLQDLGGFDSS